MFFQIVSDNGHWPLPELFEVQSCSSGLEGLSKLRQIISNANGLRKKELSGRECLKISLNI